MAGAESMFKKAWVKVALVALSVAVVDQAWRHYARQGGPDAAAQAFVAAHPVVQAAVGSAERFSQVQRQPLQAFGDGAAYRIRLRVHGTRDSGEASLKVQRSGGHWAVVEAIWIQRGQESTMSLQAEGLPPEKRPQDPG